MAKLRLSRIDDLLRPEHSRLEQHDICVYVWEYTPNKGYAFSADNSLILNFKKGMDRRGCSDWKYKEQAIARVAEIFQELLPQKFLAATTLVPIPPSRARDDQGYDDRMVRALRKLEPRRDVDVRELIFQHESIEPAHSSRSRPGQDDIYHNYRVDETLAEPRPREIALFDDVLTTGAHFKASQRILEEHYPGVRVVGVFIARRVFEEVDFDI